MTPPPLMSLVNTMLLYLLVYHLGCILENKRYDTNAKDWISKNYISISISNE